MAGFDGGGGSNVDGEDIAPASVSTEPVTVYVRPDGDDANSGLDPTDAKASISAAKSAAPLPAPSQAFRIDIGGGTYTESVRFDDGNYPSVEIVGDGTAVIDATGLSTGVFASRGTYIHLSGVDTIGGIGSSLLASYLSGIYLHDGTHDVNGATDGAVATNFGFLWLGSDGSIINTANGSEQTMKVLGGSVAGIQGDISTTGDEADVFNIAELSRAGVSGNIDGGGATFGARCTQLSAIEISGSTIDNVSVGVRVQRNSLGNFKADVTWNVGAIEYQPFRGSYIYDEGEVQGASELADIIVTPAVDLTAASGPKPTTYPMVRMHDGTTQPAGLYRADPGASQWVKVEDNTVTIAY